MKKLYVTFAIILVTISISLAGTIIYFNYDSSKQSIEEQEKIQQIKNSQGKIDEEFYKGKQERSNQIGDTQKKINQEEDNLKSIVNQQTEAIKNTEASKSSMDQDGDGLTAGEEEKLGTSDNSRDSDLDGVPDSEDAHPAGGGENYKLAVQWEHNGYKYNTQFGIPYDRYYWYKNKQRGWCCEGWSQFATYTDPTIQMIAEDIIDHAKSQGETCLHCVAIDFVESMVYQKDIDFNNNQEYPKYAIETIIDEKGDCEDTSFLMASVLKALNIDAVILIYSDHAAVGVACNGCSGTYYTFKGKNYFFLETTGAPGSWQIGQIWGKYGSENPKIIEVV